MRAVAVLVDGRWAVAEVVVEVGGGDDLVGQLGVRAVDAGVDDRDARAVAARDVPGGREVLARGPPFGDGAVLAALGGGEARIVGDVAQA